MQIVQSLVAWLVPVPARNASFPGRVLLVAVGQLIFSYGLVMTLQSGVGLGPWTVLAQGLTRVMPVSFGMSNNLIGLVVVLGALALGIRPALGTLMNMILVGVYADLLLAYSLIPDYTQAGWSVADWLARLVLIVGGTVVVGLATAIYIKGGLGAGPRDGLMLGLVQRWRRPIAPVRTAIEITVLIVGILLGGTAGIGTLIWALAIGPSVQLGFRLFRVSTGGAHPPSPTPTAGGKAAPGSVQ